MKPDTTESRMRIKAALKSCLKDGGLQLLSELGYLSEKTLELPSDPKHFWDTISKSDPSEKLRLKQWKKAKFLFQLTNDEIPSLGNGQTRLLTDPTVQKGMIESFVFLNIDLEGTDWKRSELAEITREINRVFPMPAIIVFVYGNLASLAVIDRRINKRDTNRDVLAAKIAIIKDIRLDAPHRAHVEILLDLSIQKVGDRHQPGNFRELYNAWLKVLDVKELNKRFYNELYDWYHWAVKESVFPKGQEWEPDKVRSHRSVAVTRLLTRLLFVWFIKEKGLVPDSLFETRKLEDILRENDLKSATSSSYYRAILQNLFFATLNTEQGRDWMSESGQSSHRLVHSVYRYKNQFKSPEQALDLFRNVPFLNGGLFECLDREITDEDLKRDPSLRAKGQIEGSGLVLRVDGFSNRKDNAIHVPNMLFFGTDVPVDLGQDARTKKGTKVSGLIEIFGQYKFTVEENTPVEEEVALDPELLGKVFENLLASYNPDTRVSARKQSGSFYTPREVVEFMVNESLIAHLDGVISDSREKLRKLVSYDSLGNPFDSEETQTLVRAIESLRVLDPAVGSGAFPMGMLQKLVHVLGKLDPDNSHWKRQNREPLERQLKDAESIPDPTFRETKVEEAEEELKKLDLAFENRKYSDYARKLYLIEKCLYGVDIQPIAVTIAKLRFFISLAIEQDFKPNQPNGNITPLPNLETKLVAANSLVRVRGGQFALRSSEVDRKEDEIKQATERIFAARTYKTKRKYRERVINLRQELADLLVTDGMLASEQASKIVRWDQFDQNSSAGFFDPEWMFGLNNGFDIVIGNPPYGVKFTSEEKKLYNSLYGHQPGQIDSYLMFMERARDLLTTTGLLTYIVSNTWLTSVTFGGFRRFIYKEFEVDLFLVADKNTFEAVVDTHAFVMPRRGVRAQDYSTRVFSLSEDGVKLINSFDWELRASEGDSINLVQSEHAYGLFRRIRKKSKQLSMIFDIFNGVKPFEVGKGTPPQTKQILELKPFVVEGTKPTGASWRPLLRGSLIDRYTIKWDHDSWINYGPWLAAPRDPAIFEAPWKILVRQTGDRIIACASACDFVARDNLHIILPKDFSGVDDWLLLILNSSVIDFVYQSINPERGEALAQVKKDHVEKLPIPAVSPSSKSVCCLLAKVLETLTRTPDDPVQMNQYVQLANGLVFELYFPDELHDAGIRLFDELLDRPFWNQDPIALSFAEAASKEAQEIFRNDHPIYRMLFDLQALPVVRTIEGKD